MISLKHLVSLVVTFCFIFQSFPIYAAQGNLLNLPEPGKMISLSSKFVPAYVKGISIYPNDPFKFDFIIDTGDSKLDDQQFKAESNKLIKYFMAALTVPEKEDWVNLSPYEKDRIIPESLGITEMGRDMLAQDYILKQLTSSLIYPDKEIGKEFWSKVYAQAQKQFGTTDIPVNTFNKVWIVPAQAVVWEHDNSTYVVRSHLKVMLEQDYLSLQKHMNSTVIPEPSTVIPAKAGIQDTSVLGSQVVRAVVLPALEKEVNEGANFATVRQIFNSAILAAWYKQNLKQTILGQVYANQNKVAGVDLADKQIKQKIYERYLQAFKKGAFNFIKEDNDPLTNQSIPRKYFSGGVMNLAKNPDILRGNFAQLSAADQKAIVTGKESLVTIDMAQVGAGASQAMTAGDVEVLSQFHLNVTENSGKQTGQALISSLQANGAGGAIIAHSEVLESAAELGIGIEKANEIFANQVRMASNTGWIDIIVAVGETKTERDKGKSLEVIKRDVLARVQGLSSYVVSRLIIAYEPRWAIGGSGAATAQDAQEMAAFIRAVIRGKYGNAADTLRILYGGSADGNNAADFLNQPDIDGLLVGGKSLSVGTLKPILDAVQSIGPKNGRIPYVGANWKTDVVKSFLVEFAELLKQYDRTKIKIGIASMDDRVRELKLALIKTLGWEEGVNLAMVTPQEAERAEYQDHLLRFAADAVRSVAVGLTKAGLVGAAKGLKGDDRKNKKAEIDISGQRIVVDSADRNRTVLSIHVNEGEADEVEGSLTPYDLTIPKGIASQKTDVTDSENKGQLFYLSLQGEKHAIAPAIIDVVEGTDATADNDPDKIMKEKLSGGTSIISVGQRVRQIGKIPELYALQFFAYLGEHAQEFKQLMETAKDGQSYHLFDPELYAQNPEMFVKVVEFLQEKSGKSKTNFKMEVVVMDRPTERPLIDQLKLIQKDFPGLVINTIKAGTVAHGVDAVLSPEQYKKVTGQDRVVDAKVMLTRGGAAEAYYNLVLTSQLSKTGAVGAVRLASLQMQKDGQGGEVASQSRRYEFTPKEVGQIRDLREKDGDKIINGELLFNADELTGKNAMALSAITDNGVLNLPAATAQEATVITFTNDDSNNPVINITRQGVDPAQASKADAAALATKPNVEGGINLDANLYNLQVLRDGKGRVLPISQQPIGQFMKIKGFKPVFLNIERNINLPARLGVNLDKLPKERLAQASSVTA